MDIIKEIERAIKRWDFDFKVGDTIAVSYRIKEGGRERVQVFEGTVIKIQNHGVRKSFTVRRLSYGIGVERTFPYHSPRIENIKVIRRGKVRRAKLFYIRGRQGKAAKIKEKKNY